MHVAVAIATSSNDMNSQSLCIRFSGVIPQQDENSAILCKCWGRRGRKTSGKPHADGSMATRLLGCPHQQVCQVTLRNRPSLSSPLHSRSIFSETPAATVSQVSKRIAQFVARPCTGGDEDERPAAAEPRAAPHAQKSTHTQRAAAALRTHE